MSALLSKRNGERARAGKRWEYDKTSATSDLDKRVKLPKKSGELNVPSGGKPSRKKVAKTGRLKKLGKTIYDSPHSKRYPNISSSEKGEGRG